MTKKGNILVLGILFLGTVVFGNDKPEVKVKNILGTNYITWSVEGINESHVFVIEKKNEEGQFESIGVKEGIKTDLMESLSYAFEDQSDSENEYRVKVIIDEDQAIVKNEEKK